MSLLLSGPPRPSWQVLCHCVTMVSVLCLPKQTFKIQFVMINPSHVTRAMMYFQTSALMLTQMGHTFGPWMNQEYILCHCFQVSPWWIFPFHLSNVNLWHVLGIIKCRLLNHLSHTKENRVISNEAKSKYPCDPTHSSQVTARLSWCWSLPSYATPPFVQCHTMSLIKTPFLLAIGYL